MKIYSYGDAAHDTTQRQVSGYLMAARAGMEAKGQISMDQVRGQEHKIFLYCGIK
jgi:hypothetical protein